MSVESQVDLPNPLLTPSPLPYGLPPFAEITLEHLRAAHDEGMAEELAQTRAIATDPQPPTFANTLIALERSGRTLDRAQRVFGLLNGSSSTEEIQQLGADLAPRLAAHRDSIMLDRDLWRRIDALYEHRAELRLDAEELRLLERYHLDFVRAGAALDDEQQQRLRTLNARLAELSTELGRRLLADTNASAVHVDAAADLDGLSPDAVAAAGEAARGRGLEGYLITLVLPTHQPALARLTDPGIRSRLLEASLTRGTHGDENDTRELVAQIVVLRAERAALLGYRSHSDYVLADRTAGSNAALDDVLHRLIPPAVDNAVREGHELASLMAADTDRAFAASDRAFYAERLRREKFDFDTAAARPYCELQRVLVDGVFFAANRLYGLTFEPRDDLVGGHPEAVVYEVFAEDGTALGLFVGDFFTRDSKRGGAWCEALVSQSRLLDQRPVVVNTLNVPKPPPGQPALLTLDEVRTMFHEFGHALHGLLSSVTFPRLAGTAVARDFVEYPSQVNEMWLRDPAVTANYLRHVEDGTPPPAELMAKITDTSPSEEGFSTAAYLAAAWLDLAWHRLDEAAARAAVADVEGFETSALAAVGLHLDLVPPRYRTAYFNHIFVSGYSAGYYSYIWSEVLDADTVEWFGSFAGSVREAGQRFADLLLSRGGTAPEMDYVTDVLGREPSIEPLLRRRGLA